MFAIAIIWTASGTFQTAWAEIYLSDSKYPSASRLRRRIFMKVMTMKMNKILPILAIACLFHLMLATGCKYDSCKDPSSPDCNEETEEELITTVSISLTDTINSYDATFRDLDGIGGSNPTVDTIKLPANAEFDAIITFLDESDLRQTIDITAEILAEDDEHIICFTPVGINLSITNSDSDGNFPVGLVSHWNTGTAGTGTVRVTLKHQPNGLKDGSCAPGETDIEVDFPILTY